MPLIQKDSPEESAINQALTNWAQGDCTLDFRDFFYAADRKTALTPEAAYLEEDELQVVISEIEGCMVVTQTCDIVRSCTQRPFIQVAPLVRVIDAQVLREIRIGKRPNYVYIPGLADSSLVADLDRIMTVEKSIITTWTPIRGCIAENDARHIGQHLGRKFSRFAFPDDFNQFIHPLQRRLSDKHNRQTQEGDALRKLQEIRIQADPNWNAAEITVYLLFILEASVNRALKVGGKSWDEWGQSWVQLLAPHSRYQMATPQFVSLEDLSAQHYLQTDTLDLDHLSLSALEKNIQ
jgi:hypothetical protein